MRGPRTKAARQAVIDRCEKTRQVMNAIITGLERGQDTYSKIYDRAIAIKVELQEAGFQIVRKPGEKLNGEKLDIMPMVAIGKPKGGAE